MSCFLYPHGIRVPVPDHVHAMSYAYCFVGVTLGGCAVMCLAGVWTQCLHCIVYVLCLSPCALCLVCTWHVSNPHSVSRGSAILCVCILLCVCTALCLHLGLSFLLEAGGRDQCTRFLPTSTPALLHSSFLTASLSGDQCGHFVDGVCVDGGSCGQPLFLPQGPPMAGARPSTKEGRERSSGTFLRPKRGNEALGRWRPCSTPSPVHIGEGPAGNFSCLSFSFRPSGRTGALLRRELQLHKGLALAKGAGPWDA